MQQSVQNVFDTRISHYLERLERENRRRRLRPVHPTLHPGHIIIDGRRVINFSSNDYLGLSHHPLLKERAADYAHRFGAGSCASRLVCGDLEPFRTIETKIATAKKTETALILAAGWQANAGVLSCLLTPSVWEAEPLVFCDRLNHASIHAGLTLAGARQIRYHHNDLAHLRKKIMAHTDIPGPRFIITESVFSMDGDTTDISALASLAREFGAFLYVDDAHATGVLGPSGFGLANGDNADLIMGTFSKGLGGFGSYVACSRAVRDYLVNRCGSLIYSTGLPPSVLGAIDAAIDLVPELADDRHRLSRNASDLRTMLQTLGYNCGASTTQIVPIILGEEAQTLSFARTLEERGILGVAIRPPTVPKGASRIRLTLSSRHDADDLDVLYSVLETMRIR